MNDWFQAAAACQARAQRFRPTDPAQLQQEVRRLSASGLRPRDVAEALRLNVVAVEQMLKGHAA